MGTALDPQHPPNEAPTMSTILETEASSPALVWNGWTAADLLERFGPLPLSRIRLDPAPGLATEADAAAIRDRERRLFELVDGVLVEKAVGVEESALAFILIGWIAAFLRDHDLGLGLGPDGMARLAPGLIRVPDVSFISWERLPGRRLSPGPHLPVAPDLAVEILSPSNTAKEMDRKIQDYFDAGVRLVWVVEPALRRVEVFTGVGVSVVLRESDTLDGGEVLPGFAVPVARLFEGLEPRRPG